MKKKELLELRAKELLGLKKLLKEKRMELSKSRLDLKASREKNLKKVKNLRRTVAQILTVIREKEIATKEVSEQEGQGE